MKPALAGLRSEVRLAVPSGGDLPEPEVNHLLNVARLKAHWYERTVEPMIHHNLNLEAGHDGPPLWASALDASNNGIVIIDRYGVILVYNRAARRMLGDEGPSAGRATLFRVHAGDVAGPQKYPGNRHSPNRKGIRSPRQPSSPTATRSSSTEMWSE